MNNLYDIFLLDNENQVKLDCDGIDMTITFSIADIADISVRKDSLTKTVLFKGTKNNNIAFGSLFANNKITDTNITGKIGFNYNPLRTVDCYVYENGMILLKGSMRVLEIDVTKDSEIIYQTCVTGKFIDFKSTISDKELTDLDFSDLKHEFKIQNITNSWNQVTFQTVNGVVTQRPVYSPPDSSGKKYLLGNGYVYPFIDYGIPFNSDAINFSTFAGDVNKVQVMNFKSAIYVKEYLDRIFKQEEISDFSYEIKGSDDFLRKFRSLIIPNADEDFSTTYNVTDSNGNNPDQYLKDFKSTTTETQSGATYGPNHGDKLLSIPDTSATTGTINISPVFNLYKAFNNILILNRTVKTNGFATATVSSIHNPNSFPVTLNLQLVKRKELNNQNATLNWEVLEEGQELKVAPKTTISSNTFSVTFIERDYNEGEQVAIRLRWAGAAMDYFQNFTFTVNSAELKFPASISTPFTTSVRYEPTWVNNGTSVTFNYDKIQPHPPKGIKQIDFLKSLINLFNFYVYTKNDNPKHLIFQQYDDFYGFTTPQYILSNSINWTEKIDYSSGYKIKPNIQIPKNYSFSYKEDSDFSNDNYRKTFNEVYGTFSFIDTLGVTDEKKVEIIFSPTPIVQYDGTGRMMPALYTGSTKEKTASKTNIRIFYYNGLQDCTTYAIAEDIYGTDNLWHCQDIGTYTQYPNVSSYYYENGIPVEDLNFGRPKLYNFPANANFINATPIYNQAYRNQLTELTNPNIYTVQGFAMLNEIDIHNLDLRIPVFIDMGNKGQAYFKILSIEYQNNYTPSKVILQKIFLGTER